MGLPYFSRGGCAGRLYCLGEVGVLVCPNQAAGGAGTCAAYRQPPAPEKRLRDGSSRIPAFPSGPCTAAALAKVLADKSVLHPIHDSYHPSEVCSVL